VHMEKQRVVNRLKLAIVSGAGDMQRRETHFCFTCVLWSVLSFLCWKQSQLDYIYTRREGVSSPVGVVYVVV
jgi:hypothetical protein